MIEFLIRNSPLLYFTQSLWRDEAFSILIAEKPISFFFTKLVFEPPFYYVLLHFWIKVFGESEIAARSLSLLGLALATYIVIVWSEKLFKKGFLVWFLPVFFFLNPMLLYYGFEIRTYGWYIFWATLSMYTYLEKRWVAYVVATLLGFYTHTYFAVLFFVEVLHWLITNKYLFKGKAFKKIWQKPFVRAASITLAIMMPWLYLIINATAKSAAKLKQFWYFPVDLHLVKSVLGNMFLGYEGTPWFLWTYTKWFSLGFLFVFVLALKLKSKRSRNLFFVLATLVPLAMVVGISFIKPLFVNRYLIFVSIAQVFLVAFALEAIGNQFFQRFLAAALLIGVAGFNLWYPAQHAKLNIRSPILQINVLKTPEDLIFAESPLIFFETLYYSRDRSKVFLYNPSGSPFPWYVGDAAFSNSKMVNDFPAYPTRAFLVHENGSFDIVYRMPLTGPAPFYPDKK